MKLVSGSHCDCADLWNRTRQYVYATIVVGFHETPSEVNELLNYPVIYKAQLQLKRATPDHRIVEITKRTELR
jgi:hypothetical protein